MPIIDKIIGTFDIVHRAGLWELVGLNFIAAALQKKAIILVTNKIVVRRKLSDIKLLKSEIVCICTGLLFMMIGAIVESAAIISTLK